MNNVERDGKLVSHLVHYRLNMDIISITFQTLKPFSLFFFFCHEKQMIPIDLSNEMSLQSEAHLSG